MRREENDVLALSVLVAAFVASDHTDPLARAVEMHARIRSEVDESTAPDADLAARAFELHAQLLTSALAAGHDVAEAMKIADHAVAAAYAREDEGQR